MDLVWIRKPTKKQKELLESQPTWEHDVDKWNAHYDNRVETCLVIEGSASVTTDDGKVYSFNVGDLVTFAPNMDCIWEVTKPIKKYYIFDMDLEEK